MGKFEATEELDLIALEDALQGALDRTDDELKRKRAAMYTSALKAQRTRYENLLHRVKGVR